MPETLSIPIDTDADWELTATDDDGDEVAFAGTETLSASVWPGEGYAQTFAPAVVFLAAPTGRMQVSIARTQTAALELGTYRMVVYVVADSKKRAVWDGWLKLTSSPGVALAGPVYCTYSDMRQFIPWIDKLPNADTSSEGFLAERMDARKWMDSLILRAYPGEGAGTRGAHSEAIIGWQGGGGLVAAQWLIDMLAGNALITTGPVGREVARVCALYATAQLCRGQLGPSGKPSEWEMRGNRLLAEAYARASQLTVELDTNDDGEGDLAVPMNITNTRYA